MRMSPGIWNLVFLATFFFAFYNHLSESEAHSDHHKKLSPAIVVGTVYCETCFHQDFSKSTHIISGATVAVECRDRIANNSRPNFRELVKTNEHGEFKVHLPFSVSKHVKKIKACSVKLISSSEPFCAVASTATSSLLRLKSRKEGTHIFSAGFFTFKPLKQPQVCDQKPSIRNPRKNLKAVDSSISTDPNDPAFLPPIRDPPSSPDLPSVPNLPGFPTLPPLPVPEIPYIPPVPTKEPSKESRKTSELADKQAVQQRRPSGFFPFLPPNPLLPPPSIIPPVLPTPPPSIFPPIFPAPPPSIFPPIVPAPPPSIFPPILPSPPSPPPSIFPPLIPLPGLNPPPPPPRSPSFPFPIPLPPGFPGVPPASEPKKSHP